MSNVLGVRDTFFFSDGRLLQTTGFSLLNQLGLDSFYKDKKKVLAEIWPK